MQSNENTLQRVGQTNATTNNAIVAAEVAKVQAQCLIAINNPRSLLNVENRVNSLCESVYVAKEAEYEYTRGTQRISGPTIKLMSSIAQCYGNITSGWKEVSRTKDKSKVIAFAWDIENNFKYDLEFEVPLFRETKAPYGSKGTIRTLLASDRDIYEHVANFAARRVRKCIESVIPRYLIDMALEKCKETLIAKIDVKGEIKKIVNWLKSYQNIDLEQLEEKLGMKYDAFGNIQYTTLAKWSNALRDGTGKKEDLFPNKEVKNSNVEGVQAEQKAKNASIKIDPKIIADELKEAEIEEALEEVSKNNDDWLKQVTDKYGN